MKNNRLQIEKLKNYFGRKNHFTLGEIVEFYRKFEEDVKKTTVSWRVYTLVQEKILQRISRGVYVLGEGRNYTPELTSKIKSLFRKVKKEFPYLNICIWNTVWLNEFMIHQPNRFYTLLEVEKDVAESVFYYLKETNSTVFLEPSKDIFENYLPDNKESIIVKSLVSEAPLLTVNGIKTASIEKMLVDVFCDDIIFSAQQGSEIINIFKSAYEKYTVSQSKLLRYANRRGRKKDLIKFTSDLTNFL